MIDFRYQLHIAHLLGERHGHEWACVLSNDLDEVIAPCRDIRTAVAEIERVTLERRGDYPIPGITSPTVDPSGVIRHTTRKGTLGWEVDYNCRLVLGLWRPDDIIAARSNGELVEVAWGHPLHTLAPGRRLALAASLKRGSEWVVHIPIPGAPYEPRHVWALADAMNALSPAGDIEDAFQRGGVTLPEGWAQVECMAAA